MRFRVEGVDATTGRDVDPLIVEAEDEAAATSEARRQGVRPANVKLCQPTAPPAEVMGNIRSAAPVLLGILGWIFWGLALMIMFIPNDGSLRAIITFGTFTISGLICIVGGMIIGALDRDHRRPQ